MFLYELTDFSKNNLSKLNYKSSFFCHFDKLTWRNELSLFITDSYQSFRTCEGFILNRIYWLVEYLYPVIFHGLNYLILHIALFVNFFNHLIVYTHTMNISDFASFSICTLKNLRDIYCIFDILS